MNRITVWEIAKLLPPTGLLTISRKATKKVLGYTYHEIPEDIRQEQINMISSQELDKNNIDIEDPRDVFKMLMKYRYEFLTSYFRDEIFEKQIKKTTMWQDQIMRHKYVDLKRYCKLNDKKVISLYNSQAESTSRPYGNKYNIDEMDFHTFDTYYKSYGIFRVTVDLYNKRVTRKSKLIRRMRGMKTTDAIRPEGYYNV